jgi:hypothetical protein
MQRLEFERNRQEAKERQRLEKERQKVRRLHSLFIDSMYDRWIYLHKVRRLQPMSRSMPTAFN